MHSNGCSLDFDEMTEKLIELPNVAQLWLFSFFSGNMDKFVNNEQLRKNTETVKICQAEKVCGELVEAKLSRLTSRKRPVKTEKCELWSVNEQSQTGKIVEFLQKYM